jgi:hypothetical protein
VHKKIKKTGEKKKSRGPSAGLKKCGKKKGGGRIIYTMCQTQSNEYDLYRSKASELLEQAAARHPNIQPKLAAPCAGDNADIGADHLYLPFYVDAGCGSAGCNGCNPRMLVRGPDQPPAGPAVLFGVVASGERHIA